MGAINKLVIPAQAGIQQEEPTREADKEQDFCPLRGVLFRWIPACAGMKRE
jgi:hypothetical protein